MTDHQAHLARIETEIAALQRSREQDTGLHSVIGLQSGVFSLQFQLHSLAGDLAQLDRLNRAIDLFSASSSGPSDLWLVQAHIAVKLHRFRKAQQILHLDPCRRFCPQGRLVQADLHVQQGRYREAREDITLALESDLTWDGLARLAYLEGLFGNTAEADDLYVSAQDELSAKQMHAFVWIEVQRGMLDFQRGRYTQSLAHYHRARSVYSGYWFIEERSAELEGALGNFPVALTAYTSLYQLHPRPEWAHALGDLCSLSGDIQAALGWRLKALAGYQASVSSGQVHYLHYLVDLACELPGNGEAAVQWARRDEESRSNYQTQGNLAWSLYRCGQIPAAQEWIRKALESRIVCARLYLQAACIHAAAGDTISGAHYFHLSKSINPVPVKARFATRPFPLRLIDSDSSNHELTRPELTLP